MSDHELRKALRRSTAELVAETISGSIDWGAFLWDEREQVNLTSGRTGEASTLLISLAPTPFILDGAAYASVESFYHSLKFPVGSARRAEVAAMPGFEATQKTRRNRARIFRFRGVDVEVDSIEHIAIVAEAVSAKVGQNPKVAEALRATGRARLDLPDGSERRNALGRATPIALMIERAKLR